MPILLPRPSGKVAVYMPGIGEELGTERLPAELKINTDGLVGLVLVLSGAGLICTGVPQICD